MFRLGPGKLLAKTEEAKSIVSTAHVHKGPGVGRRCCGLSWKVSWSLDQWVQGESYCYCLELGYSSISVCLKAL